MQKNEPNVFRSVFHKMNGMFFVLFYVEFCIFYFVSLLFVFCLLEIITFELLQLINYSNCILSNYKPKHLLLATIFNLSKLYTWKQRNNRSDVFAQFFNKKLWFAFLFKVTDYFWIILFFTWNLERKKPIANLQSEFYRYLQISFRHSILLKKTISLQFSL